MNKITLAGIGIFIFGSVIFSVGILSVPKVVERGKIHVGAVAGVTGMLIMPLGLIVLLVGIVVWLVQRWKK